MDWWKIRVGPSDVTNSIFKFCDKPTKPPSLSPRIESRQGCTQNTAIRWHKGGFSTFDPCGSKQQISSQSPKDHGEDLRMLMLFLEISQGEKITNIIFPGFGNICLKKEIVPNNQVSISLFCCSEFKNAHSFNGCLPFWVKLQRREVLVCSLHWPCYHRLFGSSHCHSNFQTKDSFL